MLTPYLIGLLAGAVLIGFSLLGGGEDAHGGDVDIDGDVDTDVDGGADAHDATETDGEVGSALGAWLPLTSLRLWTFFLTFGGLTGACLTLLTSWSPIFVGVLAIATGLLAGIAVTRTIRSLRASSASALAEASDYVGSVGAVRIRITPAEPGQVRLHIRGRDVDLTATTEEDTVLDSGASVIVYRMRTDGVALVEAAGGA